MAKKTVATLKKEINYAKLIRAIKSEKTGAYCFKEEIMPLEQVKDKLKES